MRSPDKELSLIDHGDDMQRRVRYQATYLASKAISMLDSESEIDSIFCEQHEDCLIQLKRGGFAGMQVKTRLLSRNPLGSTDEDILKAIARFIEADKSFPTKFKSFGIGSNHGFRTDKTIYSLGYLISEARKSHSGGQGNEVLDSYVERLNKATETVSSVEQLVRLLIKLNLESGLPQFEDFELTIAEQIGKRAEYANLALPSLKEAAGVLVNRIFRMSSLESPRLTEMVLKEDPRTYEAEQIIANKKLTPRMVRAVLQSAVVPNYLLAPTQAPVKAESMNFTKESLSAARMQLRKHSKRLSDWPTTLDRNERIETPCLSTLKETVSRQASSTQLIIAPPGAGKSALLAVFSNEFDNDENVVLALRADQLPASTDSFEKLQVALGLEYPVIETLSELAKNNRVIVVLDQLDALSELTCLNPERLLVLLSLIEKLAEIENIHIIASAREFDADHDPHLRRLDAQRVLLPLPEWHQISALLDSRNIKHDGWPDDFKVLLRTPQYLKIFLDIHKSEQDSIFRSYKGLLNALWRLRVENVEGTDESLLVQIAERMSRFEELTVPASCFSDNRASIERFVSSNIIQEDVLTDTLTFTHQTLFEYVRARTFLKGSESLSEFVMARQTSLFIRPQLWHTLGFMREGSDGQYRIELSTMFQNANLRFHLKFLIIEFLGQQAHPKDYEMALVLPMLADKSLRSTILASLAGSPGWFQKLASSFIPSLMRGPKEDCEDLVSILRAAVTFDREAVLDLLEQNWTVDNAKDILLLNVLDRLGNWCDRSLKLACTAIERNRINPHAVTKLCGQINLSDANMAIELLLSHLKSETRIARSEIPITSTERDDDSKKQNDEIQMDLQMDHHCPRRKALIRLLDREDFYILDKLVASNPQAFVEKLWPWLTDILFEIIHSPHEFVDKYPSDGTHVGLDPGERNTSKYSIIGAMDQAISMFSTTSPELFCKFVEENKSLVSLTLQRLLARGLANTVTTVPALSLSFLTEDTRRLCLGGPFSEHADTCKLIMALYPQLNHEGQKQLNTRIEKYTHYNTKPENDGVETRKRRLIWDRQHRLTLLQAIPGNLAPSNLSKLKNEEERALPPRQHSEFEGGFIGSPMTSEQMSRASIDDLQKIFLELNDATRSSHPKDWSKGGTIQLSRELLELVKKDAEKVRALVERFQPGINEIAAGFGVQALASVPHNSEDLYKLIARLDTLGFKSNEFRGQIAGVIRGEVISKKNVPTEIVELLKRFILEYSGGEPEVLVRTERKLDSSLLWRGHTDEAFSTTSTFTFIHALLSVFLVVTPPDWNAWLAALETFLERKDIADYNSTWRLLALQHLTNLRFTEQSRAHKILESLLRTDHSPLISNSGAYLLARIHGWLDENLVVRWLQAFFDSDDHDSQQLYGELLCLHFLWFPERQWAARRISDIFESRRDTVGYAPLKGIAYSLGHLWSGASERSNKTRLLFDVLVTNEKLYFDALSEGLTKNIFPTDEYTKQLLSFMAENRLMLKSLEIYSLVDNLQDLIEWYPEEIYKLSLALIEEFGSAIGDINNSYALVSESLVDLVIRLQHQSEPARSWGLELFERLVEHRIPDARAMLNSLDRRIDRGSSSQRIIS